MTILTGRDLPHNSAGENTSAFDHQREDGRRLYPTGRAESDIGDPAGAHPQRPLHQDRHGNELQAGAVARGAVGPPGIKRPAAPAAQNRDTIRGSQAAYRPRHGANVRKVPKLRGLRSKEGFI
jgi:hypothetical protein